MSNSIYDITVLVTAAGAQFMPGLVNCLKNNGERAIRLIGVDMSADNTILQLVDKFYKVPDVWSPEYIQKLWDICKIEHVDIIMPFMSAELQPLAKSRADFKSIGTVISVSEGDAVKISNNKLKLYDFMVRNSMETPKYKSVCSIEDLNAAFDYIGYPSKAICVKATESSGSRGVRIVDPSKSRMDILFNEKPNSLYISYNELVEILSEKAVFPEMMAMEYLPGIEYSVDLLADNGKIIYIAGRESNVNIASIPQVATLKKNTEAYDIAAKIVGKLKLDGNADLDFKFSENGHPILMEVNPRIAATMQIFKEGGLNLPYLRIKQLLGESLPEINVNYGIIMHRRYCEMFTQI